MQLLTLAAIIASLATLLIAAPTIERKGPCAEELEGIGESHPGKYMPRCTPTGFYQPMQCHGSTGFCWCADPETGKEVHGTRTGRGQGQLACPSCHMKKADMLKAGVLGAYVPQCNEFGLYAPMQFHGSTGQSWCVDLFNGEEFDGTRRMPGQEPAECTGSQYCRKNETEGRPCCAAFFTESGSVYRMQCTRNGYFKTEQTIPFGDKPMQFCVNPSTGFTASEATAPNCGGCFKYIEERLSSKQLLGSEMPMCIDHTGQFAPLQKSHDGYRWCVDLNTGAMLTEKRRFDDKTPLPCELTF
jgi:hemin uptake protein HemP